MRIYLNMNKMLLFTLYLYRAEDTRSLAAAHGDRKSLSILLQTGKMQVQEGVGRTAGSSRRVRDTMNHTSFLGCFRSSRALYFEFRVSSYSPTAFFLIQYFTVLRSLCRKIVKSEGRQYEGGMRITFKYAKKGAVSTEMRARTEKNRIQLQQR